MYTNNKINKYINGIITSKNTKYGQQWHDVLNYLMYNPKYIGSRWNKTNINDV